MRTTAESRRAEIKHPRPGGRTRAAGWSPAGGSTPRFPLSTWPRSKEKSRHHASTATSGPRAITEVLTAVKGDLVRLNAHY